VYEAGLGSSPWQQVDHTETRVDGQPQHCQVVCNPVYTSYHTQPRKDRLSVLDVLRQGRKRIFRLNREALGILQPVPMSKAAQAILPEWCSEQDWEETDFVERLEQALPNLNVQQRTAILGAAAVAAYHAEQNVPRVDTLLCDDAPEFHWLTRALQLCWVHDGRLYKKLEPVMVYCLPTSTPRAVYLHRTPPPDLGVFWSIGIGGGWRWKSNGLWIAVT